MFSQRTRRPVEFRSLFYALWLGPFVGGICSEVVRSVLRGGVFGLQALLSRIGMVYVLAAVIGYPLFLLLVRYDKLHFAGFTCAGIVAGVVVSLLYLFAHLVLNWFSDGGVQSIAYAFASALFVAWAIWAVSRLAERIDVRRDE